MDELAHTCGSEAVCVGNTSFAYGKMPDELLFAKTAITTRGFELTYNQNQQDVLSMRGRFLTEVSPRESDD